MKALLLASLLVAGCYSNSAVLMMPGAAGDLGNGARRVYRCEHSGWGYLGAPVARIRQNQCVKDAKLMGYTEEMK